MTSLIHAFQKISHGKTVLFLFILTNLVYTTMLLYSIPRVSGYAPGLTLFDMSPAGYGYDHALALLTTLGEAGRDAYLTIQLPIDFVYPGLFAITYSLLLTWAFKNYLASDSRLYLLSSLPVLAGLFDYLENVAIITMLRGFPDLSQQLVHLSSTMTIIKSGLTSVFFVVLLLAFIPIIKRLFGPAGRG